MKSAAIEARLLRLADLEKQNKELLYALRCILGNASNHATGGAPEAWADAFAGLAKTAREAIAKAEGR